MISKRITDLVSNNSVIREIFEEGKRLSKIYGDENIFDFSLGNPTIKTPPIIKNTIIKVLNTYSPDVIHGYMPNAGFQIVRSSIANHLKNKFKINYDYKNITMVNGAAGGINCILQTILNPNDEVIVCSPFFVEYKNYIENWLGKMIIAETNKKTFMLDKTNIYNAITNKTKAIIINNPNNPTGVVYNAKQIKEITNMLREKEKEIGHEIYIIADEPYRELIYKKTTVPYIPKYYKNTFVVYSWSKSLSLAGERIGYIATTPSMKNIDIITKAIPISNRVIGFVNSPSLMQLTIKECLDSTIDVSLYDKNRILLYKSLTKIGYECIEPKGAFYLWVKTPIDENEFVQKARKEKILVVPGSSFFGPGYIRIAYCVPYNKIKKSIPLFKKIFEN